MWMYYQPQQGIPTQSSPGIHSLSLWGQWSVSLLTLGIKFVTKPQAEPLANNWLW